MNNRHHPFSFYAAMLVAITTICVNPSWAFDAPAEREKELLDVIRSTAPPADKALACKNLAIYGSASAVPELSKLLPNPQLSSWARIALEAIPGDASDQALREAADRLEGRLLVGVINSIGFRRDAKAIGSLTSKLTDGNSDVASAAAVALGHIGGDAATDSLRKALAKATGGTRSAVAEGCVLCAERFHNEGESAKAMELFDVVRNASVPMQRKIEATRGAILARKQDGIPLLLETFRSNEKKMFQLALSTAREFPGGSVDKALANELTEATPGRAALMIQAMADRPDTVVLPAVLKAAGQGDKEVRLSAIDALSRVGDESCLATLLQIALEKDADLAISAKQTLADLPGEHVDREIGDLLPTAKGSTYVVLLQLIGQRRISAVPELIRALEHSEEDVRNAAFVALGETVSLKRLSVLISQVIAPTHPEDASVAQQALKAASVRMPDRDACAEELATAIQRSPVATKIALLEILSDVGGATALQRIAAAAKSEDTELQDAGSRLLGKWNSVAAAPVLLDLAKTGPAEKYQVRALRGYIGLARKFSMPEQKRAEMCRNALDVAVRPAEQKLVLDVLKLHPSTAGLKLAIDAITIPGLKDDATPAALMIAQKVGGKAENVRKLMAGVGLDDVNLEIVKAEYGAGNQQKDVTAALRRRARKSALITLAAASYNASFGGDPAPGVVKRLKIEYRINGKAGETSFPENALIILPIPK